MQREAIELRAAVPTPKIPLAGGDARGEGVAGWVERLRGYVRPLHVGSLEAILAAVDAKDPYTRRHSMTVAAYAEALGRRMHLTSFALRTLRVSALLHDVGKIGVPDRVLNKPGPLDADEAQLVRRHPQIGVDILRPMRFLANHRSTILYHHEWYDGRGYPAGLWGEQIPLSARILAVVDAIDTMLSPRTYKRPYTLDEVRAELIGSAGRQFDPHLVGIALEWLEACAVANPAVAAMA